MYKNLKYYLPALIASLIPFAPSIYENNFTNQDVQFLFDRNYKKNPVEEWNREISKLTQSLDPEELKVKTPPPPLLRAIGKEIRKSAPEVAAGFGLIPYDQLTVDIYNQSDNDLRNVRVNFSECKGHYEVKTYPDATGSIGSQSLLNNQADTLTVNYGNISRKDIESYLTKIVYYGDDASKCIVSVNADLKNGMAARGEEVQSITEHVVKDAMESYNRNSKFDMLWKFIMAVVLFYLVFVVRKLKNYSKDMPVPPA